MKIFSARANPEPSPEIARGCLTTNLMVPGLGSLAGGRKIGWLQMALCFTGEGLTIFFGARLFFWVLAHWSAIYHSNADDPFTPLREMWPHLRLPLLGIILYVTSWLWALSTSLLLLKKAKASA